MVDSSIEKIQHHQKLSLVYCIYQSPLFCYHENNQNLLILVFQIKINRSCLWFTKTFSLWFPYILVIIIPFVRSNGLLRYCLLFSSVTYIFGEIDYFDNIELSSILDNSSMIDFRLSQSY